MADELRGYRDGYSDGRIDILRELKQRFDDENDLSMAKKVIDEKIKEWEDVEKSYAEARKNVKKKNLLTVCKECLRR